MILVALILSVGTYAQINGVDFSKADPELEDWECLFRCQDGYMMMYPLTVIGYKHCINDAYNLVFSNDCSIGPDNTTIPKHILNLYDYEKMHNALNSGTAEIRRGWKMDKNNWSINLICSYEHYAIVFLRVE